ncbi:AraC family transcriptional regulator [Marinobacterium weihaiense]|uniref:AraC family transcriptional regulator n=1 Tax=Marinobacterium weihaiense TaxID=2851016 RepID=A0ABS6M8Q8_9GAMM|nr:AraC family transcriptional regulator [Marinobacterium weihaiense]MBV0932663.1 AraC family transcriptional regulator [Marinobacterium weihaiense]
MNTDARYIIWLLDFLAGQGVDTRALCAAHDLKDLESLDTSISQATHRALLGEALQLTDDSGLGLKLGHQRSLATYDQLAYLMMSCSTLREAIETGLKYQNYPGRFSGQSIITTFSEIDGQGCFQVNVKEDLGALRLLAIEELLSNIIATTRWVLGRPLPVTRLRCDYSPPPHAEDYLAIFGCEPRFEAPVIQLFFDAAMLDAPLPNASPQSARLYEAMCEEQSIRRQGGNVAWRLWPLIVEDPANPPGMTAAAEVLCCSPRTLRRRLQSEGWQYQQIIDRVREIHARRALSDPTLSVTEVALQLGYADHSGFLKAFKKWTGMTPRAFRRRLV